jgi:NAD+ dependent glucose-6-phosphate dehydrogenase
MVEAAKRVIVTGSSGNLGTKAVTCLKRLSGWEVIRLGRNLSRQNDVISAELERFDASWARYFRGADAVLHLAADPKPVSSWNSITRLNIDLALNVFRAAEEGRGRRFVFASSNWVLGGYRFGQEILTSTIPPKPINPYGASKLFLERYGVALAARTGMSVLALRIGYCQPGENRPGPNMAFGRWGQQMWLGNRDWEQAVLKAVMSPYVGAAILNIVSRNDGMRWEIDSARRIIGYDPEDHHRPTLSIAGWLKEIGARLRDRAVPAGGSAPLFGARW